MITPPNSIYKLGLNSLCHIPGTFYEARTAKFRYVGEVKVISNVTCISDGSFLEFFQLPVVMVTDDDGEEKEKEDGTGEAYGKKLHETVKKFKAEESVTYMGADSTRVNTGHKTGTGSPRIRLKNGRHFLKNRLI